jgi:hypothetical protein
MAYSVILNHAMRWSWHDRSLISMVRQSAKRQRIPTILLLE